MDECDILQLTRESMILRRIRDRGTIRRELGTLVNRSGTWLAVRHAGALKNTNHKLALRDKKDPHSVE
jgi:hypothetical protein